MGVVILFLGRENGSIVIEDIASVFVVVVVEEDKGEFTLSKAAVADDDDEFF